METDTLSTTPDDANDALDSWGSDHSITIEPFTHYDDQQRPTHRLEVRTHEIPVGWEYDVILYDWRSGTPPNYQSAAENWRHQNILYELRITPEEDAYALAAALMHFLDTTSSFSRTAFQDFVAGTDMEGVA